MARIRHRKAALSQIEFFGKFLVMVSVLRAEFPGAKIDRSTARVETALS
jgi:hypothetical protein